MFCGVSRSVLQTLSQRLSGHLAGLRVVQAACLEDFLEQLLLPGVDEPTHPMNRMHEEAPMAVWRERAPGRSQEGRWFGVEAEVPKRSWWRRLQGG